MEELKKEIEQVVAILAEAVHDFSPVTFANSMGAEDMVLTDLIERHNLDIEMFSLDTGRLPQETYDLMQIVSNKYSVPLRIYFPNVKQVEEYVAQNGVNGFYDSVALRKNCCHIRKVEPLRRALVGKRAWVTGVRREQAPIREKIEYSEYDVDNRLQKFNPLLEWTHQQVWTYIKHYEVPYNTLHDSHFPSIGCAPCTRAITPGEDVRSGRWWWESPESKECGLHSGKVIPLK